MRLSSSTSHTEYTSQRYKRHLRHVIRWLRSRRASSATKWTNGSMTCKTCFRGRQCPQAASSYVNYMWDQSDLRSREIFWQSPERYAQRLEPIAFKLFSMPRWGDLGTPGGGCWSCPGGRSLIMRAGRWLETPECSLLATAGWPGCLGS